MKRKGTFSELGGWFIGIVIVLVVIFILFGPKKLFAQVRNSVFNLGVELPEEESPQLSGIATIPPDLDAYFDKLVSKVSKAVKNSGTKKCLIDIESIPETNVFDIALKKDEISIERKDKRGNTPLYKSKTVKGFKPCYVKDSSAQKFYECRIILPVAETACPNQYIEKDFNIDDSSHIAPFLFKFDNNHLCVIYLDGLDADVGRCTNLPNLNLIDDECVDDIKRDYQSCS